ncbi:MAG: hypothetical protein PVI30_08400 [Myxococcales bacterium]
MTTKTLVAPVALLLALVGCRENQTIDPNNAPVAEARIDDDDAEYDAESNAYTLEYDGDPIEVTLDGSGSMDRGGRVVGYQWISGTPDPETGCGRYVPDGVDDDEDDTWPADEEKPEVTLDEGRWTFHLYVTDDDGAVSPVSTVTVVVGDPAPVPTCGGEPGGDGDDDSDAGSVSCVEAVAMQTAGMVSAECAACACGQGGTCETDLAECTADCWNLVACIGAECADDASESCTITAATGPCMEYLAGGQAGATAVGTPCIAPCAAECAM